MAPLDRSRAQCACAGVDRPGGAESEVGCRLYLHSYRRRLAILGGRAGSVQSPGGRLVDEPGDECAVRARCADDGDVTAGQIQATAAPLGSAQSIHQRRVPAIAEQGIARGKHSTLGYVSPAEFERQFASQRKCPAKRGKAQSGQAAVGMTRGCLKPQGARRPAAGAAPWDYCKVVFALHSGVSPMPWPVRQTYTARRVGS